MRSFGVTLVGGGSFLDVNAEDIDIRSAGGSDYNETLVFFYIGGYVVCCLDLDDVSDIAEFLNDGSFLFIYRKDGVTE